MLAFLLTGRIQAQFRTFYFLKRCQLIDNDKIETPAGTSHGVPFWT